MDLGNVLVIIPAFNEELTVGQVIGGLRAVGFKNILVVDDGSTDQTNDVARRRGVTVLSHLINLGVGGATATGLSYARRKTFPFAVTVDADGQHLSPDVLKVVSRILEGRTDVVIGSRFLENEGQIPPLKRSVLKLSNLLTRLLFGVSTTDSQSGLRAFSRPVIESLRATDLGYEFCSGMFAQIKENGWRYAEVPVQAVYSDYSLNKGQPLSNSFNLLARLLSLKLNP